MTAVIRDLIFLNPEGSLIPNLRFFQGDEFSTLPLAFLKYMPVERSYEHLPTVVKEVLDEMLKLITPLRGMRLLVDYKVRDLKAGEYGCPINNWHLDCVTDPRHKSQPETHLIFTTEFGTEYITTPVEVFSEEGNFNKTVERLRRDSTVIETLKVEPNTITGYTRFNLHRGPLITRDCRRVVLRLTQTEVI